MVHTMGDPEQNRMGDQPLDSAGVEILVDKAVSLEASASRVALTSGRTLAFKRLALATGIQKGLIVRELDMMQIATHPLLTLAPTVRPLISAATRPWPS